jgi:hypothetical protein
MKTYAETAASRDRQGPEYWPYAEQFSRLVRRFASITHVRAVIQKPRPVHQAQFRMG